MNNNNLKESSAAYIKYLSKIYANHIGYLEEALHLPETTPEETALKEQRINEINALIKETSWTPNCRH
jgi:hypothetical protein